MPQTYRVGDYVIDKMFNQESVVIGHTDNGGHWLRHNDFTQYEPNYPRRASELTPVKYASKEVKEGDIVRYKNRYAFVITVISRESNIRDIETGELEMVNTRHLELMVRKEDVMKPEDGRLARITREDVAGLPLGTTGRITETFKARNRFGKSRYVFVREGISYVIGNKDFEYISEEKAGLESEGVVGHKAVIVSNGRKHHHYKKGDVCHVKSHAYPYGYVLARMGDGFEQVVTRDAFEIFTESPQKSLRDVFEGAWGDWETGNKEEIGMGGELHGYPPEDDKVAKAVASRIAELEEQLKEKEQQYEVVRREKVAEEYGIVAERHLWDVVVDVPMRWVGKRMPGGGERSTEVVTEGRDMCEAAMAAEAMAKGISDKAYVVSIKYNRVLGAIK